MNTITYSMVQTQSEDSSIRDNVTDWVRVVILEHTETLVTLVSFETFDQSDKKTWPDQQKGKYIDKNNDKDKYI